MTDNKAVSARFDVVLDVGYDEDLETSSRPAAWFLFGYRPQAGQKVGLDTNHGIVEITDLRTSADIGAAIAKAHRGAVPLASNEISVVASRLDLSGKSPLSSFAKGVALRL